MRKAERLFQVVNLIRVHQPITAAKLAERLNVSVRTVYRYIDDLSLSGIPIYGEAGVGYAMHEDFELPPLSLDAGELEALGTAVELLSKTAGHELAQSARSLLAKIDAALPRSAPRRREPHILVPFSPLSREGLRHWEQLRRAIHDRHGLRIRYASLGGVETSREIVPLGLFYWGGKWTVGGWCLLRQDYRDFRVDLIRDIAPAASSPALPLRVSLPDYLQHQARAWQTRH